MSSWNVSSLLLSADALLPVPAQKTTPKADRSSRPQVIESYGKLPLSFEANQGQTDRRTNVPTYRSVKYSSVYPGIDLVYHGNQKLLEFDFVVAPGVNPNVIDLRFQGAEKLVIYPEGDLAIRIGGRDVIAHLPAIYQEVSSNRHTVAGRYSLRGNDRVSFAVSKYDRTRPLVIDPTLVYSTYLGGSGDDYITGLAVDASGSVYVTGYTYNAIDFPISPGAFQNTFAGYNRMFVSKLNSTGSTLVYSTYLGTGWANAIAVDGSGNAYVGGEALSSDFPTTPGAFQTVHTFLLTSEAFVTKLNATGSGLIYSTLLGGEKQDSPEYGETRVTAIAVDNSGSAYLAGWTWSPDFPTTPNAFQKTYAGLQDVFVTKLNASGSGLLYSTFLGSSNNDMATGIAVDALGEAYVTGVTVRIACDFPLTPGALQTSCGGNNFGPFVTKLNASGSGLIYSTYFGSSYDGTLALALDGAGNAYLTGSAGASFPTTPGSFKPTGGGAFVSKLNAIGSTLLYSTFIGDGIGTAIAVDSSGNAYVTGEARNSNFPTTPDAIQTTYGGGVTDTFFTELNAAGSEVIYSSYLGTGNGVGTAIAIGALGDVYVAGTASNGFPTTQGAFQPTYRGGWNDGFIAKLSSGTSGGPPVTTPTLSGAGGANGWYVSPVIASLTAVANGSPILATYYSLDGGASLAYSAPLAISGNGTHQLNLYSVDTSGHQEKLQAIAFKIDSIAPVSHVAALPAVAGSPNFKVQWSGTDVTSGLSNYAIFVSDNGGPFNPWLAQTTSTQAWYVGSLTHTYRFYSAARDVAGNVEIKTVPDATIFVPQMPGDANGDGQITCADLAIVKASMGKSAGQGGFDPRADVNHDGVVNVLDLAIVSQKLIPATTCP